jgi:hypothetical protein
MLRKLSDTNRICLPIALLVLGSLPVRAQRLDGCAPDDGPSTFSITREVLDTGLQRSGVALTREALTVALQNPRADIRSLAALRLAFERVPTTLPRDGATIAHEDWDKADMSALVRAWAAESDSCTKREMNIALNMFAPPIVNGRPRHPGYQPWITPFQPCTASEPPVLTLTVEQATVPSTSPPTVRISIQNQTQEVLAFIRGVEPEELFSVTVLGPSGDRATVAKGRERLFEPLATSHLPQDGSAPIFFPLPPKEPQQWIWKVSDDFDMSEPGTYRVSLGGRLAYLDTTVCSNTAEVKVGN